MLNFIFFFVVFLCLFIFLVFSSLSKSFLDKFSDYSSFECGFTPYFRSRISFSVHYFVLGIIFLFLDLELCVIMPFFLQDFCSFFSFIEMIFFVIFLLFGLFLEWGKGQLDWKF